MTRVVDVTLRNEVSEIAVLRDELDRLGSQLALPAPALMQLHVALDEIVSNVIKYSWTDGGSHVLSVRIAAEAAMVSLDIVDDGRPFDPREAPAPSPPLAGRRPRPGGLGLHMVKKLVDELAYERIDGRNHTRLTKHFAVDDSRERTCE
jgi:serine/threonine-protein kinase RsbW